MSDSSKSRLELLELPNEIVVQILEYVLPPWHLYKGRMYPTPYGDSLEEHLSDLPGILRLSSLYPEEGIFLSCRRLSDAAKLTFWHSFTGHVDIDARRTPNTQKSTKLEDHQYVMSVLPRITDLTTRLWARSISRSGFDITTIESMPRLRSVKFLCIDDPPQLNPRERDQTSFFVLRPDGSRWRPLRAAWVFKEAWCNLESFCSKVEQRDIMPHIQHFARLHTEAGVPSRMLVLDVRPCSNDVWVIDERLFEKVEESPCVAQDSSSTLLTKPYWKIVTDVPWPREATKVLDHMERLVSD